MLNGILGIKIDQYESFDKDGNRIPVTKIQAGPCPVVQIKTIAKDGYNSVQLGFGQRKKIGIAAKGHFKKANLNDAPFYLRELKGEISEKKEGENISVGEIFKEGDKINVTGITKGKGFAGVVKRHHFHGGPGTHGQSDRERAPGSIGSTTTPGRVYKGKRMAGKMGDSQVTVKNLKVFAVDTENNTLLVRGLVPGARKGLLIINKIN